MIASFTDHFHEGPCYRRRRVAVLRCRRNANIRPATPREFMVPLVFNVAEVVFLLPVPCFVEMIVG